MVAPSKMEEYLPQSHAFAHPVITKQNKMIAGKQVVRNVSEGPQFVRTPLRKVKPSRICNEMMARTDYPNG